MKSESFMNWFVTLIEQDMEGFEADADAKQQVYHNLRQRILDHTSGEWDEQKIKKKKKKLEKR